MAISPSKPDRIDVTSRGKAYVWLAPTIAAGGDTIQISGIKEVWTVSLAQRSTMTFTYTTTGAQNSCVVLTVTHATSCTGPSAATGPTVLYVEGR